MLSIAHSKTNKTGGEIMIPLFVDIFYKSRSNRTTENLEDQYYEKLLYPFMHNFGFDYLEHLGDNSWMDDNKESIKNKLDTFKNNNQIMYGVPPYIRKRLQDNSSYNEEDKLYYLIKLLIGDYFRFTPNAEYRENNDYRILEIFTLIGGILLLGFMTFSGTVMLSIFGNYLVNKICEANNWFKQFIIEPFILFCSLFIIVYLFSKLMSYLDRTFFEKRREEKWIDDYTMYNDSFSKLEKRSMEGYKKIVEYGRYE